MPKHIARSGGLIKSPQALLAKEALRHLASEGVVSIDNYVCTVVGKERSDQSHVWRKIAAAHDRVIISEVVSEYGLTNKQAIALRQWLSCHGYCSGGKGVMVKRELTHE